MKYKKGKGIPEDESIKKSFVEVRAMRDLDSRKGINCEIK